MFKAIDAYEVHFSFNNYFYIIIYHHLSSVKYIFVYLI